MVLSLTPKVQATKTKLDGRIHQTESFCTAQETMNNLKRPCSFNAPGISEAGGDCSCVEGKRVGWERMVTSQVMSESLGWPPSVGTWLRIGRKSRMRQGEVKNWSPGRKHSKQRVWAILEGKCSTRIWPCQCLSGGHRLMSGRSVPAIFRKGWGFPGTGSAPTFWPLWSAMELSWRLCVCHLLAVFQRDLKIYIYFRS